MEESKSFKKRVDGVFHGTPNGVFSLWKNGMLFKLPGNHLNTYPYL